MSGVVDKRCRQFLQFGILTRSLEFAHEGCFAEDAMHRRQFLGTAAAALLGRIARAESLPSDLKVTRIVSFDLHTRRAKFGGKNDKLG